MQLSEHDQRQLSKLSDRLELFINGGLELGTIIADIEFLLNALVKVDESEKDALRKIWGVLEEVNAVTLDSGKPSGADQLVNKNIEELRARVGELLS